jgi:hypothetical protein
VTVRGVCDIPDTAVAVSFNVTAVDRPRRGTCGSSRGHAAAGVLGAELVAGRTRASNAIVPLGSGAR